MRQEDMATFYPTSSSQIDVLSSSYIEDQKFTPFSEQPILHGNNMMMYLNNPSSTAGSFPGISPSISSLHNEAGRNEMMFIPPTGDSMCIQAISAQLNTATTDTQQQIVVPHQELQLTSRTHQLIDGEKNNLHGLSLSLSTQIANTVPPPSFQHHFSNPQGLSSVLSSHVHGSGGGGESSCRPMSEKLDEGKDLQQSSSAYGGSAGPYELHGGDGSGSNLVMNSSNLHSSVNNNSKGLVGYNSYQYEQAGIASALLKSKYLKAAQMLLDEVVNVREALKQQHDSGNDQNKMEEGSSESKEKSVPGSDGNNNNEPANGSTVPELSPTERQDLQNKLDKLLAMLDEVDRRYKQYYHQMQILVSSFDMVAGSGAAKPYTTLALKTISRHFRCLRDAISGQIQQTRKSLGDQDSSQGGVIPRLRYIDQQLRQQRALQQFGMMRHAWRPQRGLPENAVTILRAWLFEHFLHPYPKDSEKIMLARQTGLTRSQVANWFINARVRLWKPMVEEMYKEEFGESDLGAICKSSPENTTRGAPQGERSSWISEDRNRREDSMQESISSMGGISHRSQQQNQDESGIMLRRPAAGMIMMNDMPNEEKHRGMLMKLQQDEQYQHHRQQQQQQQHSLGSHHGFYAHDQNGFMVQAYHVPGLGGYSMDNNQVSLALGLRRIEGDVGSSLGSGPAGSGFRSNSGSMENGMAVAAPGTGEYHPSYIDPVVNQQQHVW